MIATPISFSLSKLLNNLFEIGRFPDMWKLSHVTSNYKHKGFKNDKVNFRRISLLPTLSKSCESVIQNRLLSHCLENDIISKRQAAYLRGTMLLTNYLTFNIKLNNPGKNNQFMHGVFLDIDGAFDKVWHSAMKAKLNQIGITGNLFYFYFLFYFFLI